MRLKDKVALITGVGSGIGKESAILFAKEGAKIAGVDIDDESGNQVIQRIQAIGGQAKYIHADVSNAVDVQSMIKQTADQFGGLHILFNNAGIMHSRDGDAISTESDVFDLTLNINVKGVWLGCKYGIPEILRSGGGSIINTASFVAHLGAATPQIAYTASKGAVMAMTRGISRNTRAGQHTRKCTMPRTVAHRIIDEVSGYRRKKATKTGPYPNRQIRRSS